MKLISELVEHKKYGTGVITEACEGKITVCFKETECNRMFQYPESFETFLRAVNPAVQENAMLEVQKRQESMNLELESVKKRQNAMELAEKMTISDNKKKTAKKTATKSKKKKVDVE